MESFRIKKYKKGYLVEVLKRKRKFLFWNEYYYTHYISYTGLPKEPFYFQNYKSAKSHFLKEVLFNTKILID